MPSLDVEQKMKIDFIDSEHYQISGFSFGPLTGRRFVVFDFESTGPIYSEDSITQIGAVAVYDDGPRDQESFCSLVRPWKAIPPKIEELTGVTNELVASAPNFGKIYPEFAAFCGDSALVTQAGYEFDFLIADVECDRAGYPSLTNLRLDTKVIFALLHPERSENFSTNFLSEYYRVDRTPFKRHDALGDALLISRVFHALLEEARSDKRRSLEATAPLQVRRFVLPPL